MLGRRRLLECDTHTTALTEDGMEVIVLIKIPLVRTKAPKLF